MGQVRDRRIAEFQQRAGITPADGHRAELLNHMQEEVARLMEVIVLEKSGIRDGDGYWSGSDPLGGIIQNLAALMNKYAEGKRINIGGRGLSD